MRATVLVRPKDGILDPQGEAVTSSLQHLGFGVTDVRVGRLIEVELADTGAERLREVERTALALYGFASEHAAARGILIADTKFEFGLDRDSRLVLADEAFTPDSSRFWPADE